MSWSESSWTVILAYLAAFLVVVGVVLWGGGVLARWSRDWIRQGRGQTEPGDERAKRLGYVERSCVAALTAFAGPLVGLGGIAAWIGLKLQANWQHREAGDESIRVGAISSAVGSLVSLTVALLGGLALGRLLGL